MLDKGYHSVHTAPTCARSSTMTSTGKNSSAPGGPSPCTALGLTQLGLPLPGPSPCTARILLVCVHAHARVCVQLGVHRDTWAVES